MMTHASLLADIGARPAFIAGDWGTSRLRLFLCAENGDILGRLDGPGIGLPGVSAGEILACLTACWGESAAGLPALLCGMVGSSIGWRQIPYLPCPANTATLAATAGRFDYGGREIVMAPGLSCLNPLGAPDYMRGEETQILGTVLSQPKLMSGCHLLCLPGTHTKWVMIQDGTVVEFLTALTGEIFDVMRRHTILVGTGEYPAAVANSAFRSGVERASTDSGADLVHRIFEVRSRQLSGEFQRDEAMAYLSGLTIGSDVAGALSIFRDTMTKPRVLVVGSTDLCTLYKTALRHNGMQAVLLDGEDAALRGLTALYQNLFQEPVDEP